MKPRITLLLGDRNGIGPELIGKLLADPATHEQAEVEFLNDLVRRLDAALLSKTVKDLIIVAPPRALGALRKVYSDHIRSALVAEIDKDLTTMPVDQIEKHLVGR